MIMHKLYNTKSNGRALARGMYADGASPRELTGAALALLRGNSTRPHMVAGFAEVAFKGACWNGFCTLARHDGDHHADDTGHGWEQARGTAYCPECHDYTACDHARPVTTIY